MQIITSHLLNEAAELKRKTVYYVSFYLFTYSFIFLGVLLLRPLNPYYLMLCIISARSYTSDIELITNTRSLTNMCITTTIPKPTMKKSFLINHNKTLPTLGCGLCTKKYTPFSF